MKKYLSQRILQSIKQQNLLTLKLLLLSMFIGLTVSAKEKNSISKSDTLNYSWERFSVNFGGFLTGLNSNVQVSSQNIGLGIIVNVEDALGLQTTSTVLRSEIRYNYGKRRRQTASLEYFGLFRNANKVLTSEIEIGDQIFPIGTEVNSKYNLQIFKGAYAYSFYKDERIKLDASIGLFVMPIEFSAKALTSEGTVNNFVAPLPVLGIGTSFAITPKLYLQQSIDFLYLKISNFKGIITDFNVRLEYNAWEHFGFGGGLNTFGLDIEAYGDKDNFFDFKGTVKTGYTGLLFYAKYYF